MSLFVCEIQGYWAAYAAKNEHRLNNITWKKCWLLSFTGTVKLTQNRKCYQLYKPEIEFNVIKEMYAALGMHTFSEKTTKP